MTYLFNPLQNEGFIPIVEQAISSRGLGYEHPPSAVPPTQPNKSDRWTEITDEKDWIESWFWNGTYWLSKQEYQHFTNGSANFSSNNFRFANNYNLLVKKFRIISRMDGDLSPGGQLDSNTNYWDFSPHLLIGGSGAVPIPNAPVLSTKGRTYSYFANVFLTSNELNLLISITSGENNPDNSGGFPRGMSCIGTKTGNPPNMDVDAVVLCNFARP